MIHCTRIVHVAYTSAHFQNESDFCKLAFSDLVAAAALLPDNPLYDYNSFPQFRGGEANWQ